MRIEPCQPLEEYGSARPDDLQWPLGYGGREKPRPHSLSFSIKERGGKGRLRDALVQSDWLTRWPVADLSPQGWLLFRRGWPLQSSLASKKRVASRFRSPLSLPRLQRS